MISEDLEKQTALDHMKEYGSAILIVKTGGEFDQYMFKATNFETFMIRMRSIGQDIYA